LLVHTGVNNDPKKVQDSACAGAGKEDMVRSFEDPRTTLAARFLLFTDVAVEHADSSVQAAMIEKPSKEVNFGRKFGFPKPDNFWVSWIVEVRRASRSKNPVPLLKRSSRDN